MLDLPPLTTNDLLLMLGDRDATNFRLNTYIQRLEAKVNELETKLKAKETKPDGESGLRAVVSGES
jgi:hypothetical protein